jgi:hypothetical protein
MSFVDVIEGYEKLLKSGVPDSQGRAFRELLEVIIDEEFRRMRSELKTDLGNIKESIARLEKSLK